MRSSFNIIFGFDFGQSPQKLLYACEREADWGSKQQSRLNFVNSVYRWLLNSGRKTADAKQTRQTWRPCKCLWWLDTTPSKHCKITTVLISPQHHQSNKSSASNKEFGFGFAFTTPQLLRWAVWLLPPSCGGELTEVASQHNSAIKINI